MFDVSISWRLLETDTQTTWKAIVARLLPRGELSGPGCFSVTCSTIIRLSPRGEFSLPGWFFVMCWIICGRQTPLHLDFSALKSLIVIATDSKKKFLLHFFTHCKRLLRTECYRIDQQTHLSFSNRIELNFTEWWCNTIFCNFNIDSFPLTLPVLHL